MQRRSSGVEKICSVSQINQYIKNLFVRDYLLSRVQVQGEISNLKYHSSGHIYFTLKDEAAQISCVMFASYTRGMTFRLEEGQNVLVYGSISVYERDGRYQLYARDISMQGAGKLYEEYEKRKKRLLEEGLFDEENKKPLPKYAKTIGVVTAQTGAVIQDICNVTHRRNPYVQIRLYPAKVQGEGAAQTVIRGIRYFEKTDVDTIIIGRGGGSIEDLWAFNEEELVRVVAACTKPIISAVGHETDFTICDYVCDLRALTPTYAAIEATPNIEDMYKHLSMLDGLLKSNMKYKIETLNTRLNRLTHFYLFKNPEKLYGDHLQYVSYLQDKISNLMEKRLNNNMVIYTKLNLQLQSQNKVFVSHYQQKIQTYENLLKINFHNKLKANQNNLSMLISKLNALSPLQTLERGYALVKKENQYVSSIDDLNNEDNVSIYLKDGYVKATIYKE